MRSKRLSAALQASLVGMASVVGALTPAVPVFAAVQTCDWTGAGSDTNFSTVANWTNCGGAAPLAGDILAFDRGNVGTGDNLINDLGVAIGGLQVTKSGGAVDNYGASIDTLHFATGATWSGVTDYSLSADSVSGDGDLTLTNVFANDVATPGIITVDGGAFSVLDSSPASKIVLKNGGVVSFLTASGGAKSLSVPLQIDTGGGILYFYAHCQTQGMGCSTYDPTTWTVSSVIANAATKIYAGASSTANVSGSGSITKDETSEGVVNINGTIVKNQEKTTSLSGVQATTDVTVLENETATLENGSERGWVSVLSGAVLKGIGKVDTLMVNHGGKVAPGMSPGCITAVSAVSLSGEYDFELGGTDACTGYDQIKAGGVTLNSTSTLVTSRYNGYTPRQGQVFTIIDNQGNASTPVNGTFQGLAEGAVFVQNGVQFRISYVGGDGNDVTLTVMNQPTVPDTGFTLIKSNPLVTLLGTVIAAGGVLLAGKRARANR